jgi:hypothetical protein
MKSPDSKGPTERTPVVARHIASLIGRRRRPDHSLWHLTHSKTRALVVSSLSQTRTCRIIHLHVGQTGK